MVSARDRPKRGQLDSVEYAQKTSVLDMQMRSIFFPDGEILRGTTQICFSLTCDMREFLWSERTRRSSLADSRRDLTELSGRDCNKTSRVSPSRIAIEQSDLRP